MERPEETDDWMWQEALGEEARRICEESMWMVTGREGWGVLEERTKGKHVAGMSSKNKRERKGWRRSRRRKHFFACGKELEFQSQINGETLEWPKIGDNIQITIYRTFVEHGLERERRNAEGEVETF